MLIAATAIMRNIPILAIAVAITACTANQNRTEGRDTGASGTAPVAVDANSAVGAFALQMIADGRETFRHDTFGDEAFWSTTLQLDRALLGVSPAAALGLGIKVDVDALPGSVVAALRAGKVDLDDPAVTQTLLTAHAVVGVEAVTHADGSVCDVGITCALCHSTVDNSLAPGVGHRLDGWPNRDLDVGKIIALAPNLSPFSQLLHVTDDQLRAVLNSWGPGKFDAEVFLDGKAVRPDGKSAATLIPPAFGLAGASLHTYTGWGSVPYWNAFVANLLMHGQGNFFDPRLDDATKFPIAAANRFGHIQRSEDDDRITPKLPALHIYQLAIDAPRPPGGSFDAALAARGDELFSGAAKCSTCHNQDRSEAGWPMHTGAEIGIDEFQAQRSPDGKYRTTPLRGLWTHVKGGFYHDGRFATLLDVVNHYDTTMTLGLSDQDKAALVEYLKSI